MGSEDANTWILFRGTDQIGQYDLAETVYRRINTDGTFSDPTQRPWRTNPGAVPALPPLVAEQTKAKQEAKRVADQRAQEKAQAQAEAAAEGFQLEALYEKMPSWSIYAAGGGVAGLALVFGFATQTRKK